MSFVLQQTALFAVSVFPYLVGCLFRKYAVISKIKEWIQQHKIAPVWVAVFAIGAEITMLVLHGIVESSIVAPFIAIVTIILLNVAPKPKCVQTVLYFFGKHSTNIWLVHYFFIGTAFPVIAYKVRYPVLILIWTLALSIGVSYLVNFLCVPIQKRIR